MLAKSLGTTQKTVLKLYNCPIQRFCKGALVVPVVMPIFKHRQSYFIETIFQSMHRPQSALFSNNYGTVYGAKYNVIYVRVVKCCAIGKLLNMSSLSLALSTLVECAKILLFNNRTWKRVFFELFPSKLVINITDFIKIKVFQIIRLLYIL